LRSSAQWADRNSSVFTLCSLWLIGFACVPAFRAGSEAGNVSPVFVDDHGGDEDGEDEEGELLVENGPGAGKAYGGVGDGEGAGAGHGGDAHVTGGFEGDEEDQDGGDGGEGEIREDAEDDAGTGGDAFSAFEFEKDAEHVAEDRGERDEEPEEVIGGGIGRTVAAEVGEEGGRGEGGQQALEKVQDKCDGEEFFTEEAA